jgi:septal ring factor EnvC (AmiA/AmiB activator)
MEESPLNALLQEKRQTPPPRTPPVRSSLFPEGLKTALMLVLTLGVGFLLYDSYKFQQASRAELAKISEEIQALEKSGEAKISNLRGEISETQRAVDQVDRAVGTTKAEIKKTAQQIQMEGQQTKAELSQALAAKADSTAVQALKSEADSKIGQVSSEVGGVKTDVVSVKADLANTRRELEGTQRQLVDVRETLSAAVAKNSSELEVLRRKGEREYFEFSIAKKDQITKVEDISVVLKKTDTKKGKFTMEILVDDGRIEKKDRNVNEPLQFLVGKSRLRYELVVNWIQKDKAGGYLAIPK